MKTNQEKLNDAVGMLDGETVQTAMTRAAYMKEARMTRRAVFRRRAAVVLAACLSLTLMLGALLAVPLMTAEDPSIGETTPGDDAVPLYMEAPMVKLTNLSATEAATVSDPDIPTKQTEVQVDSVAYQHRFTILTIDCKPGETVTVNADSDCLYLVNMPLNENTDLSWGGEFYEALLNCSSPTLDFDGDYDRSLTFDPATSCIAVKIPISSTELDEALLTFSIADGTGTTVGVGGVYIGVQRVANRADTRFGGRLTITRCAVLGSARFTDPASVTEEQANRLVESFVARADACKATLDYTPVTKDEKRITAMAEIINTVFADEAIGAWGGGHSSWDDFCNFRVTSEATETERNFIVFDNGEWMEFLAHGNCNHYPCHLGCPNSAEWEHHAIIDGCRLTTPDGRVYEYVIQLRDGIETGTLVLVSDRADK